MNIFLRKKAAFLTLVFAKVMIATSLAQSVVYPVKEAIINGDFEKAVGINPPTEFTLDGYWPGTIMANQRNPSSINQSCFYSTQNVYAIASTADSFYCESVKKYGFGICPGCFQIVGDHTPSKSGKGQFLAIDTWSSDIGPGTRISATGSSPIVWQQTVTVSPGQLYYFTGWAANWSISPPFSNLAFFVQGNNDSNPIQLGAGSFTVTSSSWMPFSKTWNSNSNTTAVITIRNQTTNLLFGNDFALDDLSFINSCPSTIVSSFTPNLGPDKSLCFNQGSITLNSNTSINPPNRLFTWYLGTGTAQTVISASSTLNNTITVTTPGTYLVNVSELGYCDLSSSVNISKSIKLDLGVNRLLCKTITAFLSTGLPNPDPTLSYVWKNGQSIIASGSNQSNYLATTSGIYTVSVSSSVVGCPPVTAIVTVTSNLPIPGNGYTYCDPSVTSVTMSVSGTGTFNWYLSSVGGASLGTGTSYTSIITGSGTKLFYVDGNSPSALPNTSYSIPGSQFGYGHNRTKFNLSQQTQIVSVKAYSLVYQGTCDNGNTLKTVTFRLLQNGVTVPGYLSNFTFTCGGTHLIPIGFDIPAGNNYELEYTNDGYFAWQPCWITPCDIYRPNSAVTVLYDQTGQHGGALSDWIVNQVPGCMRVPVKVTQNCVTNDPITESSNSLSDFSVYPIPSQDEVFIKRKNDLKGNLTIQIFNPFGSLDIEKQFTSLEGFEEISISIAQLKSGVYFLKINHDSGVQSQKIIKN